MRCRRLRSGRCPPQIGGRRNASSAEFVLIHTPYRVHINREKIAMKIAAKRSAQGYHVSDERCELCEMPLLSMNGGNATCKVCPALKKLIQMKNEKIVHNIDDDTRDAAETVDTDSASRDNEIEDKDMDDTCRPLSDDLVDSIVVGHTVKVNMR